MANEVKANEVKADEVKAAEAADVAAEDTQSSAASQPPAKTKGSKLALLSLLLALVALAGAGYLYYQLVYLAPAQPIEKRVAAVEATMAERARELQDLQQAQLASLETLAEEQAERLEQAQQAMVGALNEASRQAPPAPREWKLAEVEYLLRIANHRVLMERDVDAGLRLLSAADSILLQLDDFALHGVRAALADEMLALKGVRGNDVQGIYLRLEAIKGQLVALPLALPEYFAADAAKPSDAENSGVWEALSAELSKYLQVRRFDGATKPLLAPEEAVYLELNLRLMLERAQLAALRRQQIVYEQSLGSAQEWLMEYLDETHPLVEDVVAEIDALLEVQLDQALPDVSGSLSALLAARRGES